jgi:hypothetical protein
MWVVFGLITASAQVFSVKTDNSSQKAQIEGKENQLK